jgi:iron complex transport system ATP-binding protein
MITTALNGALLAAEKVSVTLAGRLVVHPLDLSLSGGSLVALVGPNGAGKTSLLRALAGLIPSGGRIHLEGVDVKELSMNARARAMAYLPQGHHVHWPLPVRDIVALGRFPHGVNDPRRMRPADESWVIDAMQRTDTLALADRSTTSLSGGERARVMMARVLAVNAPIVLADEPTAALDPRHQLAIMSVLQSEAGRGKLVIAVTHDLVLAARFADHVLVLNDGKVVASGAPEQALNQDTLKTVYGIESHTVTIEGRAFMMPWSAS